MLRIILPDNNHSERKYAVEVLLKDFLGLDIDMVFNEHEQHYRIQLENGATLKVEDHFFSQFPGEKSYLDKHYIPRDVIVQKKTSNSFLPENDIPVIYGASKIKISDADITCGIDIFASTFFMLTRWEEYVCKERDHYGRFPVKASLAARAGFLHRPLVNEYLEMLWNMLRHLGIRQERKDQKFQLLLTHDVDYPLLWASPFFFLKKLGGDVFKRKSMTEAVFSIRSYAATNFGKRHDPYDTFDYLMQLAESVNTPAHFFFMAGGKSKLDPKYNLEADFIKKLMVEIHERGHRIGMHPSFETFDNEELFREEKSRLEAVSPQPITCGRQHFLRFSVPETWRIWGNCGMEWDSTMGYPEQEGFRCGVCIPFPVFDFLERKKRKLREIPLLAMDTTFTVYKKSTGEETIEHLKNLLSKVQKYRGTFAILWHNSSFNTPEYSKLREVYKEALTWASTSL
jgi:hypothetical protein